MYSKVIELDNCAEIFKEEFSFNGVHFWPLIRYELLIQLTLSDFNKEALVYRSPKPTQLLAYIINVITNTYRTKIKGKDIVIWGSNISNIKVEGNYYNRLTEEFCKLYPNNTLVLEQASHYTFRKPRSFKNVAYSDEFQIKAFILGKFRKISTSDKQNIKAFLKLLDYKIDLEAELKKKLEQRLLRFAKETQILKKSYKKFILKAQPKVMLIEGASYGKHKSILISQAKKMGVYVAEHQHGLVSSNHLAYNFAKKVNTKFNRYLPDAFLSYGEYFEKQIQVPFKTVTIGNPYLSQYKLKSMHNKQLNSILFVSSGNTSKEDVKFLLSLNDLLDSKYKITIRPHPLEQDKSDVLFADLITNNITIDKNNLYDILQISEFVISKASTVIFEAAMFNCKIMLHYTDYAKLHITDNIFSIINSPKDVVDKIKLNNFDPNSMKIWEEDWQTNYINFINSI